MVYSPRARPAKRQWVAQKERLEKVRGLDVGRMRRREEQERYGNLLELERLKGLSERYRVPGLRGVAARMGQLEQMISRVNSAVPATPTG